MLTLTLVVVSSYLMLATSATSRPKYDEREYICNFPKSISLSYIVITACARLSSRILLYTEFPMKMSISPEYVFVLFLNLSTIFSPNLVVSPKAFATYPPAIITFNLDGISLRIKVEIFFEKKNYFFPQKYFKSAFNQSGNCINASWAVIAFTDGCAAVLYGFILKQQILQPL